MSPAKRSNASAVGDNLMDDALEKVRKELGAVSDAELVHINIDIPAACATALGALPAFRALRPRIEEEAKSINLKLLDKLETYAFALLHAHTLYLTATRPSEPLPELVESATTLRDVMYADAMLLVQRGLLDAEQLRGVKTGPGHRPLAVDLTSLAQVMRGTWETISSRTSVKPEELREASALAARLLTAVGEREFSLGAASEATGVRARVFVLFLRAYDEFRRAVSFLRWSDGDADKIAPSLYAARASSGRRKNDAEAEPTPAAGADASAPSSATPSSAEESDPKTPDERAKSSEPGMPGGDPFVAA